MRIIIISQNEPFYLKKNLEYLFSILPDDISIVGCIIDDASPFGKKETFFEKIIKTYKIFGLKFFIYYSIKFIKNKLFDISVKELIKKNHIDLISLSDSINSDNSINLIKSFKPDLLVSILGRQIFKNQLIKLAPKGLINLHTALLPKYRGLMPTFWVLKNNEKFTGVSVFFVDEGIDSGPIIIQKKIKVEDLSLEELILETKKIGMDSIASAIKLIKKGNYKLIANPDNKKTYYSFPSREDVIDFKKKGKFFFK